MLGLRIDTLDFMLLRGIFYKVIILFSVLSTARAQNLDAEFQTFLNEGGLDRCPFTALYLGTDGIIPPKQQYKTPNGRFAFSIIPEARLYQYHLQIRDKASGKITTFEDTLYPLLRVQWSPDSETLVIVSHAAQCSVMRLLHWNGKTWSSFNVDYPTDVDRLNTHVIGWKFNKGSISATFIADQMHGNKTLSENKITLDIDPNTDQFSHVIYTSLTFDEYCALRSPLN